ncbi:hypothetical protein B7R77_24195 [Ralstonia solanacearum K60]|uniref:Uncharacterized protein n=1 Tax=Ralstonia solanacearum K60 TaxID=1091042 RepID=A0AAP8D2A3_RALSL|nr:hypothetical protein B7R77_24195 [Ralstonia solanacearum K60]RIJ84073.1 hypothetical protein RSP822_23235 [Ralstonia solanacearum]
MRLGMPVDPARGQPNAPGRPPAQGTAQKAQRMRRMEPSQIRALLAGLVMLGPMPADSQLPQEVIRVFDVSR